MARRGTFAPLPCASAYCQKNFKKTMKNREKGLDIPLNIRYDNQVRVVEAFPRKNIKKSEKALDIPPLIQYDNQVRVMGLPLCASMR